MLHGAWLEFMTGFPSFRLPLTKLYEQKRSGRAQQLLLSLIFALNISQVQALSTEPPTAKSVTTEALVQGQGIVWGMDWLTPDTLIFTERQGRMKLLNVQTGKLTNIGNVPAVWAKGQGGLLDVVVHHSSSQSSDSTPWIYFTYSKPKGKTAATTLARAQLIDNKLVNLSDLLVTQSVSDTARHFGSRIAFDNDQHVFFSVGDRGHRPNGQDLSTHAGSILRLHLDGSVPEDNPFVGQSNALPEIYSYGHRNPQGLCYDQAQNGLWSSEHGPRGGDEVNWITSGTNYGWAEVSHGKEYWGPIDVGEAKHKAGMADPKKLYIPSIAPGSLLCYQTAETSAWQGNLFLGALKLTHLNRLTVNAQQEITAEERLLQNQNLRIRALQQDPQGNLYVSTDDGQILRIAKP